MTRRGAPGVPALAAALWVVLAGCAPALDWRETRPPGSGLTMLFPCRVERQERAVRLAGRLVAMAADSCRAAGATFSLATLDAGSPGAVTPVLAALRAGAVANVGASGAAAAPLAVDGTTPNPQSGLLHLAGRLPDGRPVSLHAAFFVKGMRLYQASVIGESIPDDASDTFFEAIRVAP